MIGPEALTELAQGGFRPKEPCALITFDDAYRDNIDLALPILRDLRVPAAFFVPTGFLDRPRLTWWDHIAYVIKTTRLSRFVLDVPGRVEIDREAMTIPEGIAAVVGPYLTADPSAEALYLAHLDDRAEVEVATDTMGRSLFATWDDIRSLADSGMIVGSHTTDHLNLARQSESDQTAALGESRRRLERELGREVDTLAYPYGTSGDFTPATQRIARDAGYRVAFSTAPSVNRPGTTHAMDVHRFFVGEAATPTLFRARMGLAMAFGKSIL